VLPHDDFHDAAFGATVRSASLDAREHAVAIHGIRQIIAADEQIAVHTRNRLIRYYEAVTIAVRNEAAGYQSGTARLLRWCSRPRRRLRFGARLRWLC
jgi:hypothetical protein